MITSVELNQMSSVKISEADKSKLVDIKPVVIDLNMPIQKRFEKYIDKIKNPYCYLCGDTVVKIEFADTGKPLDDLLTNYLTNLRNR
ncbi:MAG: hypothetical protein FWC41_01940 [Firmicutes bacterium]|nr:hypothetical protein [Bacillota bacterium]